MSNTISYNVGDTVRLQLMQCRRIYVSEMMIGYGHTPVGGSISVIITEAHLGFIKGDDLELYKIQPEQDDDYYAVIDLSKTVTITKVRYERLERDSLFLSALEAHGVDNWDGYSDAYGDSHPDEEEDDDAE